MTAKSWFRFAPLAVAVAVAVVVPAVVYGACGGGADCVDCLSEGACIAFDNCAWVVDECVFDGIVPIAGTIGAELLAYAGSMFTDLSLLVVLAIGLPLAFWVLRKVIALVRVR